MTKKIPQGLSNHARARTDDVVRKIDAAMAAIERDIEANEGVYPFNGGRVTQAEVCRRAQVHKITLQGPSHKATTRKTIDVWLARLGKRMLAGAKTVRKVVTERADNWRELYLAAVRRTDLYRIESIAQEETIATANKRIAELEAEVAQLRFIHSEGKVVRLTTTHKPRS